MAEIVELMSYRPPRRTTVLALIAHDVSKPYLVRLLGRLYRVLLMAMGLTTGITGKRLMDTLGLKADRTTNVVSAENLLPYLLERVRENLARLRWEGP